MDNRTENGQKFIKHARQLSKKLTKLLELKRHPLIIEFCGTPKAGKTTIVEWLVKFLGRDFKAKKFPEKASIAPIKKKGHVDFNIWVSCATLNDIIEAVHTDIDILVVDRGIFDALCWNKWLEDTGKISQEEVDVIDNFFLLNRYRKLVSLVFVLKCNPIEAIKRESKGLPYEPSAIMNKITIRQYNKAVDYVYTKYKDKFKNVEMLDTTNLSPAEGVEKITVKTLETLKDFLDEKILVIKSEIIREALEIPTRGYVVNPDIITTINQLVKKNGQFIVRSEVEKDDSYFQIIPCGVIRYNNKIMILQRDEPGHPLHKTYAIWAGGHVKLEDNANNDPLQNGLRRELDEELYIKRKYEIEPMGLVRTNENKRAARHLGVVHNIILDSPEVALALDQKEFKEARGRSLSGQLVSLDDADRVYKKMGDWSKDIFDKIYKNQTVFFK